MQPDMPATTARKRLTTEVIVLVEIAGVALVAFGVGLIYVPAGIIAAGIGLVLFALAAQMGGGDAR